VREKRKRAPWAFNGRAYTVIDVLVLVALLAVLAAVIGYTLAKQRARSSRLTCTNNLKQISLSFKQWGMNSQDSFQMRIPVAQGGTKEFVSTGQAWVHFRVMSNELSAPKVLICPDEKNKSRRIATTFANTVPAGSSSVPFTSDTNVSYFVGVDAQDIYPRMWLSGDANFAIGNVPIGPGLTSLRTNSSLSWNDSRHGSGRGNICLADGSVEQIPNSKLVSLLMRTGDKTNRLAMP